MERMKLVVTVRGATFGVATRIAAAVVRVELNRVSRTIYARFRDDLDPPDEWERFHARYAALNNCPLCFFNGWG